MKYLKALFLHAYSRLRLSPTHSKNFVARYVLFALGITLISFTAYGAGYRINLSPSVPRGLWKVDKQPNQPQRGGYAIVPMSDAGEEDKNPGYRLAAERGYLVSPTPMLKRIVAVEGDFVSYDEYERAVTVNGGYVLMTEILSRDTDGRPMPSAPFPVWLMERQVWLSSENIRGYDSRYFGPVSSDILRKATPVWIFR
jgi:conjugative transfer signal peptidase TraF